MFWLGVQSKLDEKILHHAIHLDWAAIKMYENVAFTWSWHLNGNFAPCFLFLMRFVVQWWGQVVQQWIFPHESYQCNLIYRIHFQNLIARTPVDDSRWTGPLVVMPRGAPSPPRCGSMPTRGGRSCMLSSVRVSRRTAARDLIMCISRAGSRAGRMRIHEGMVGSHALARVLNKTKISQNNVLNR